MRKKKNQKKPPPSKSQVLSSDIPNHHEEIGLRSQINENDLQDAKCNSKAKCDSLTVQSSPIHKPSNETEKSSTQINNKDRINYNSGAQIGTGATVQLDCANNANVEGQTEQESDAKYNPEGARLVSAGDEIMADCPMMVAFCGDFNRLKAEQEEDLGLAQVSQGYTPLHLAVINQNLNDVRELGSDRELLKMRDLYGRTALHLAVNSQNIHLVKALMRHRIPLNSENKFGTTPLLRAVVLGNIEIAGLLLEKGANPNLSDHDGVTPLHQAVLRNNLQMAGLLINKGANLNPMDKRGLTPLCLAGLVGCSKEMGQLLYSRRAVHGQKGPLTCFQKALVKAANRLNPSFKDDEEEEEEDDEDEDCPKHKSKKGKRKKKKKRY